MKIENKLSVTDFAAGYRVRGYLGDNPVDIIYSTENGRLVEIRENDVIQFPLKDDLYNQVIERTREKLLSKKGGILEVDILNSPSNNSLTFHSITHHKSFQIFLFRN